MTERDARAWEPERDDLGWVLALTAAWLVFFAYVDPRGDFPLNDDFQYANSVRHLLREGELRLSSWSLAANIPHILLGALGGAVLGDGNFELRRLTLGLGCAGLLAFFAFLRSEGLPRPAAALGAGALASPLYLTMSASFHAEISTFILQLLAVIGFLRGLRRDSPAWLMAGSLALAGTVLNRQTNVLSFAGAAALLALERRLERRALAAALLPGALMIALYALWFAFVHGPTWAWHAYTPPLETAELLRPAAWRAIALRVDGAAQTLALLLLPVAAALLPQALRRPVGTRERWALAALAALAAFGIWAEDGMPLIGNTLSRMGLGVVTVKESVLKPRGFWGTVAFWRTIDLLCLVSSLALARAAFAARPLPLAARAGLLLFVPAYLALGASPVPQFDRYLMAVSPWIAAALLLSCAKPRAAWGAAAAGLLLLLSAAGLRDYFAWNQARWAAGERARALGVPPERMRNGFDVDGERMLESNLKLLLARKKPREIGPWDWSSVQPAVMFTSFSPEPPLAGFALVQDFPYESPLLRGPGRVYLYGWVPGK